MKNEIVSIHQPNFFPWLGYFDKIARSDSFVLLDDVQFPKKGGGWANRVRFLVNGEARWLTAPVDRKYHGTRQIRDMYFDSESDWRSRIIKSIVAAYGRAKYFKETMELIKPLILNQETRIAEFNRIAVIAIAESVGINVSKIKCSSQIPHSGAGTELLISLVRATGGHAYMCGGGAEGYQEDAAFAAAGVGLMYQNFQHPVYPQTGTKEFVPGLSIIDALMNIGVDEVRVALHIA